MNSELTGFSFIFLLLFFCLWDVSKHNRNHKIVPPGFLIVIIITSASKLEEIIGLLGLNISNWRVLLWVWCNNVK